MLLLLEAINSSSRASCLSTATRYASYLEPYPGAKLPARSVSESAEVP